jgi:SAM-dependent methyltransferase
MSCRICGSQSFGLWIDQGSLQIYRCGACGYGAIEPLPVPVDLAALYGKDYFEGGGVGYPGYMLEEPVHRWQARRNLKVLHRFCQPGSGPGPEAPHLLDVGCAAGFFLDEARRAGWQVSGSDVSPYAAAFAREALELEVLQGRFTDHDLEPESLDAITFFSVIARVYDPAEALRRAWKALRPGGVLMLETGNVGSRIAHFQGGSWYGISPPSVCHYFTRESLDLLAGSAGFELLRARPRVKLISKPHALALVRHKRASDSLLVRLADRLLPDSLPLAYGLGDILLAVYRRREHP